VVQSWIRQALRASGVAILVPAAIVAAVALSVIGGGGGASSLRQVLTGPAVPPAEAAQPPPQHAQRTEHPRARLRGLSPHSHARLRGLSPQSQPVTTLPLPPRRPGPSPSHSVPPATTAPEPPPSSPTPAPHPIHDTASQVAQTVRPLPVAGPVAADAVQAVADLVDPPG
jgi:hypothetical protein